MNQCACGRSPTDKCVGWHSLTEAEYLIKKAEYENSKGIKNA
jgi:hypothetical protein